MYLYKCMSFFAHIQQQQLNTLKTQQSPKNSHLLNIPILSVLRVILKTIYRSFCERFFFSFLCVCGNNWLIDSSWILYNEQTKLDYSQKYPDKKYVEKKCTWKLIRFTIAKQSIYESISNNGDALFIWQ